jgi:plasmid stabilization system protein ParE
MSRLLVLRAKARLDILEAEDWYRALDPKLADNFVRDLESALAALQGNPEQYQRVRGEVRRAALQRFPYGLFYIASENRILVMRCLHHRRSPRQWPGNRD